MRSFFSLFRQPSLEEEIRTEIENLRRRYITLNIQTIKLHHEIDAVENLLTFLKSEIADGASAGNSGE